MSLDTWNVGFHLRSPKYWLNDPNGLCQFGGTYRFFYQYNDSWPHADQKAWGQFASEDLVHWRYEGVSIEPSMYEDKNGVYSGTTVIERGAASDGTDLLRAYYTGNVIDPGPNHSPMDWGHVVEGREANQITCVSTDGVHFGPKQVLLRNADYPNNCSLHVRDPKVWIQDETYYMLLGARDTLDTGMCLLYSSPNGLNWNIVHEIRPQYPFGYMWECPNLVSLDGRDYLAVSPQGLPREFDRWHNRCQAGYFPLPSAVLSTQEVDERTFVEWDHGHDFYAPQTFVDESGRSILVGWLGGFDRAYEYTPDGLDWCHCLTVPRLLTRDESTGLLLQNPVPELDDLHIKREDIRADAPTAIPGRFADIALAGIQGEGSLSLDDDIEVFFKDGRLGLRYALPSSAAGREERSVPCEALFDLRVLVDGSVVEAYANGGALVFSSRWFCTQKPTLSVQSAFNAAQACVWSMEDAMRKMYATAKAPRLHMDGRIR
ncbi:MAG: glycoside hydrolase family 32 protein [Atopobiaceae bacterium]|nr:glycoside hydrolase family 32 protein [Atopobiaceae bacterium]